MLVGIFTDIHFQTKGLERIVATGSWIFDEFKRQGVQHVLCLGDSLNTREDVDVASQSACISFFHRMANQWKMDVILGNHDINLKHERAVSSLDALAMHPNITLHREMGITPPAVDHRFFFIPYHEDQSKVVAAIQGLEKQSPGFLRDYVAFGHLGINGAVQITRYNTRFTGAIGPDSFAPFKRTFSGHFHVHQTMDHRVTYIGSPLQFNFGDSGDSRGIVLYDTERDVFQHVINPLCWAFQFITPEQIPEVVANPEKYKNAFITVIYDDLVTDEQFEADKAKLLAHGVLSVQKESVVEKAIREHQVNVAGVRITTVADLVEPYTDTVLDKDSVLERQSVIDFGKGIIQQVNAQHQDVADTGVTFEAHLQRVTVENFLGSQGPISINFDDLAPGVWYVEGENGAGKSTIIEAITWAQHGKTIRDDMKVDDVINDDIGRNCRVTLEFKNGYAIERFRKYGGLGLDGQTISGSGVRVYKDKQYLAKFEKGDPAATQQEIDNLLGITYEWLTKTLIMGQNITANFVTADEKKRRAMLEEMLGLERFDEYLALVRTFKAALVQQSEDQARVQLLKADELGRVVGSIQETESQIMKAEADRQEGLNRIAREIVTHRDAIKIETDALTIVLAGHAAKVKDAEARLIKAQGEVDEYGKNKELMFKGSAKRGQAKTLGATLLELKGLDLQRQAALNQLKSNVDTAQRRKAETEGALSLMAAIDFDAIRVVKDKVAEIDQRIGECQQKASNATGQKQGVANRGMALEPKLRKFKPLLASGDHANCPTCEQPLDVPALTKVVAEVEGEASVLVAEAGKWGDVEATAYNEIAVLRGERTRLLGTIPSDQTVADMQANEARMRATIAECDGHIDGQAKTEAQIAQVVLDRAVAIYPTASEIQTLDSMIASLTTEIVALEADAERIEAAFELGHWSILQNVVSCTEGDIRHEQGSAAYAQKLHDESIKGRQHEIARLEGEAKGYQTSDTVNTLKGVQAKHRERRDAVQAEIESSKLISMQIATQQAYVTFWDRSFAAKGGMRAYLLEGSIGQLNEIISGYAAAIFDNGMTLTFNPDLTVKERYPKRSGGQRKGTDLAVLFAAFELERQRCRYQSDFMALDEVFDALDTKHRKAVQELLQVLTTRISRVIVVTHMSLTGARMTGCIHTSLGPTGTQWDIKKV